MKSTPVSIVLLVLALGLTSEAVQVQEGGFSFSLEAVRRLQELWGAGTLHPRLRSSPGTVCDDPALPQEFRPLCGQNDAYRSLGRLANIPLDVCDVCAYAACTGC